MNSFLWFNRKLMCWGNPDALKDLIERGKEQGFFESFGWGEKGK